jgi:hypothetical protein
MSASSVAALRSRVAKLKELMMPPAPHRRGLSMSAIAEQIGKGRKAVESHRPRIGGV